MSTLNKLKRQKTVCKALFFFLICSLLYGFNPICFTDFLPKQVLSCNNTFFKQISLIDNLERNPIIRPMSNSFINFNLNESSKTIGYNLLTKTEQLEESNDIANYSLQTIITPFSGKFDYIYTFQQYDPSPSYPFPPDDRVKITTTSTYPWSTIVKLFITAADDTEWIGSGAMLDEFHILTCGHCIYLHDNGGWADEVKVIPGMDGSYEPFGHAYATYFRTYTGWTQDEMEEHDWAVVTLDRTVGNFTGWMGRKTADPLNSIYTGTLHTAGYPGDLDSGYSMYYDSDVGEDADNYFHWYWMDSAQGQSGGPVWQYDGESRYILSINAYEYENGTYANFGTRLNQDKFDQINTWLSADSPPIDRPDLLDRGIYADISNSFITSGKTFFTIYCDVKNDGTASASSFEVEFYASRDLTLSVNDYLIGTTTIYNLDPFEYASADWSGVFPSSIPDGSYYIGWIIDAENEIDELNENNNIVIDYYLQIQVSSMIDSPIMSILLPILITVGAVLIVLAVAIIIIRRRIPDLGIFVPSKEKITFFKTESRSQVPQKTSDAFPSSIKFCPMCGQRIIRETQRFCSNCGFELRNV